MTLSDRLAAAAKARGEAAQRGHQVPTALRPEPVAPGTKRILASASTPTTATMPDPAAAAESVCPSCGRTGVLGIVDLPGRTADWSCLACGTLWQVTLPPPPLD